MTIPQFFTYPRGGELYVPEAPPATGAVAGTPGSFTPPDSSIPPTLSAMSGIAPTPLTAWTGNMHVLTGDGTVVHWNGSAWQSGLPGVAPVVFRSVGDAPGCWDRKQIPADTSSAAGWAGKKIRGEYVKGAIIEVSHAGMENAPVGDAEPTWKANNDLDVALNNSSGVRSDGSSWSLGLKTRCMMGRLTGNWAMDLGGPRITGFYSIQSGQPFTIPRIHNPNFVDFHVAYRKRFAAKYGKDPRLLDVAFEGPMSIYAEHYIQQTAKQADGATVRYNGVDYVKEELAQSNRNKLMAAGYTPAQHDDAIHRLQATCAEFECSSSEALNPAQSLSSTGAPLKSLATTLEHADRLQAMLGPRASLGNNSMRADATWPAGRPSNEYVQMWQKIRDSRGSKYYQTANTTLIGTNGQDLYTTCLKAVEMGAWMIELPGTVSQYTNYQTSWGMSPDQFDEINRLCALNVNKYPAVA